MLKLIRKRSVQVESIKIIISSYKKTRDFIPCKYCGRYDEHVELVKTPTDLEMGWLHPWCAGQIIQDAMKELIDRTS